MTYDSTGFLQAEIDYRTRRITAGTSRRRARTRVPFVRRSADRTR